MSLQSFCKIEKLSTWELILLMKSAGTKNTMPAKRGVPPTFVTASLQLRFKVFWRDSLEICRSTFMVCCSIK